MSIETKLVTKVGDGIDAQPAVATITCTDGAFGGSETITLTPFGEVAIVFTQGVDFTGGSGDDALAEEIRSLFDAVSGLTATRVNNVVTITRDVAGEEGNSWQISTNAGTFFSVTSFQNGRDADNPVDFEMNLDQSGIVTAKVDGNIVFRVPYRDLFDTNLKTFEVNLKNFLRKSQC